MNQKQLTLGGTHKTNNKTTGNQAQRLKTTSTGSSREVFFRLPLGHAVYTTHRRRQHRMAMAGDGFVAHAVKSSISHEDTYLLP